MRTIEANSSSNSWPKKAGEYRIGRAIGDGATAIVYGAFCRPKSQRCAIKVISIQDSSAIVKAFSEIRLMSKLNQENIVRIHTSFIINNEMWLVIDLLRRGSLFKIMHRKMETRNCSHGVFNEVTIATALKQVLKGLEYLHSIGIVHRDIKTDNILMDEDGTVKIGDFGLAAILQLDGRNLRPKHLRRVVGTSCWMAPEVISGETGYDFKADIWSFGITVLEMITGCAPYQYSRKNNIFELILENDAPRIDSDFVGHNDYDHYGKSIRTMMASCLKKNPAERYTASEVLNHEFFKMAKNKSYLINIGVAS